MLRKELGIFTFRDLLEHFPLRHIDKTKISLIRDINFQTEYLQVAGIITSIEVLGEKSAKRLVAYISDESGELELTWFQGINWVQKILHQGSRYLVYGRVSYFNSRPQITHPEIEIFSDTLAEGKSFLDPVYPTTEKLKAKSRDIKPYKTKQRTNAIELFIVNNAE